jgi:hypothetical protein
MSPAFDDSHYHISIKGMFRNDKEKNPRSTLNSIKLVTIQLFIPLWKHLSISNSLENNGG